MIRHDKNITLDEKGQAVNSSTVRQNLKEVSVTYG